MSLIVIAPESGDITSSVLKVGVLESQGCSIAVTLDIRRKEIMKTWGDFLIVLTNNLLILIKKAQKVFKKS
jgi:hypothetical protein